MKSNFAKIFKIVNKQSLAGGFTLIELLLAASLTTIVISLTGMGVVAITENNNEAKAETERRVELNRALDFIADEIRQAKPIATDADANLTTVAPDFSLTFDTPAKTRIPVLTLQIPGVPQRVIYYIAPKASNSPWLGPNVVYRWGPSFLPNGQYDPNDLDDADDDPDNWTYEPIADLIVDTAPVSTPSCTTGSLNPPSASITGFYACVEPNGKIADIHLRGKLTDAYGNSRSPFEVSTKAFARPYTPTFLTSTATAASSGTITFTQPSTAYFEVLGGEVTCGAGGSVIPTTTTINVTPPGATTATGIPVSSTIKALNYTASVGSKITVTGKALATSCNGSEPTFNSEQDKNTQVLTLRNGDSPPLFNPLGSQPPIDAFLTKYLDPATGKVKLAENQVILLYEFASAGSSAYDMQDLVVLATISPS